MVHIALHFFVPVLVALTFYSRRWGKAFLIVVATMLVDVDHLLANPIYDPALAIIARPPPIEIRRGPPDPVGGSVDQCHGSHGRQNRMTTSSVSPKSA